MAWRPSRSATAASYRRHLAAEAPHADCSTRRSAPRARDQPRHLTIFPLVDAARDAKANPSPGDVLRGGSARRPAPSRSAAWRPGRAIAEPPAGQAPTATCNRSSPRWRRGRVLVAVKEDGAAQTRGRRVGVVARPWPGSGRARPDGVQVLVRSGAGRRPHQLVVRRRGAVADPTIAGDDLAVRIAGAGIGLASHHAGDRERPGWRRAVALPTVDPEPLRPMRSREAPVHDLPAAVRPARRWSGSRTSSPMRAP